MKIEKPFESLLNESTDDETNDELNYHTVEELSNNLTRNIISDKSNELNIENFQLTLRKVSRNRLSFLY